MPTRFRKNQYCGINAHLHSLWQSEGGWNNFHTPHISALTVALKAQLLPLGYTARVEDSLQIRRADDSLRRPKSDITIYDLIPARPPTIQSAAGHTLTGVVLPLSVLLDENPVSEKRYRAIGLYPRDENQKPVGWIEVLSPSNKHPGDDNDAYLAKRDSLLENGIVFIEIDYLHETPPTIPHVPDYSQLRAGRTHPYRIIVLDPRPRLAEGQASINEFDVDEPIPTVTIPLSEGDLIDVDFGAPYQKQFEDMLYGLESVDYEQLPLHFDRYTEVDQARIVARMVAVLDANRHGENLNETPPRPIVTLPLREGLSRLAEWSSSPG